MPNTSLDKSEHDYKKDIISLHSLSTLAGLPPVDFDEAIKPLRKKLEVFDQDGEQSKLFLQDNVTNHTIGGMYVRELLIPQGALIISRVHKFPTINIISKGRVVVIDSLGRNEYVAPCTFMSNAGTQRMVVALEETVWNTTHIATEKTPDELVDELTFDNYSEFISYSKQLTHQESI